MRLYHFIAERYGLEAIRDSRLKIARIQELNDPFEFLGLALKNRDDREALRNWKQEMSGQFGLICMSMTWQHPLLWSHYADSHRGLCLGFDIPDETMFEHMDYVAQRPTLKDFGRSDLLDFDEPDMRRMLRIKFDSWEYEAEYRAFIGLQDAVPVSDLYFFPFSENMSLKQVIIGQRSEVTREKLERCLGERTQKVSAFKARSGFQRFEVVKNKSKSAW